MRQCLDGVWKVGQRKYVYVQLSLLILIIGGVFWLLKYLSVIKSLVYLEI